MPARLTADQVIEAVDTEELLGRRPLAEVATRCGYADQAHLTREWTSLAGCTPTTWLREEFPFVQDRGPEAGPG